MICSLYNDRLERIAILATLRSLVWCESYAEAGVSQLVAVKNDEYAAKIKTGYFIGLDSSDTLQVIVQTTDKNGLLWVYMRESKYILTDRIYDGTFKCGVVESSLKNAVMTKRPHDIVKVQSSSRLPEGYVELQYIQSDGAQYVDTGFKPNNSTRLIMDFEFTASPGTAALFGARNNSSSANFVFLYHADGYFRSNYASSTTHTFSMDAVGRHTVDKGPTAITLDGTTQSYANTAFSCSHNLYLFARNNNGNSADIKCAMLLYSCQIYEGDVLMRDYIPCRDANGAAGLYDLIGKAFYANAGTGSFTAGPAVSSAAVSKGSTLTASISTQRTYASIYDISCAVCGAVGYGFKLRHDRAEEVFYYEVYEGSDRTDVKFSERFGNLANAILTQSILDYKNVAYVGGAGEGADRVFVTVGDVDATGFDRREMFVDARDIQPEDGESDTEYAARLEARGLEKLAERRKIEGVEAEIHPGGYGARYSLGDRITMVFPEHGLIAQVRITGIKRKFENNTETLSVVFGDPVIRRNY